MKRLLIWLFIIAVAVVGAIAARIAIAETRPYKGYAESEQFVEIPQGSGPASIAKRLVDAGIIRDTLGFRFEIARSGDGRRLQAGEYRFDRPMTVQEVVAKIARGDVYLVPITFREGLTIQEDGRAVRGEGPGTRGGVRRRRVRRATDSRRRSRRTRSRGLPVSRIPTRRSATRPPAIWSRGWSAASRKR